jgi:hypothetical protein
MSSDKLRARKLTEHTAYRAGDEARPAHAHAHARMHTLTRCAPPATEARSQPCRPLQPLDGGVGH